MVLLHVWDQLVAYLVFRKVGQDDEICSEVSSLWIFESRRRL